ncbi:MAG: alpha/beta hydrolase family protein [Bradymonadia bacterium]
MTLMPTSITQLQQHPVIAALALFCLNCSTTQTSAPPASAAAPHSIGSYGVGNVTIELDDEQRGRTFQAEIWYPAARSAEVDAEPIDFESNQADRQQLAQAYMLAPDDCPTRSIESMRDAPPVTRAEAFPLVIMSHCINCGRYSSYSIAERLASHGFVVASPDHAGTLPFLQDEGPERLSVEQLDTRVDDLQFLLAQILEGGILSQHETVGSLGIDAERVGVIGHSFGAVTAGRLALQNPTISAVVGLAAPFENPLFPGLSIEDLAQPMMLVLAEEDNSILEIGNTFIRTNYEDAVSPIWRVDIADAGHWSVSDLCGLTEAFQPGCGDGFRHSPERTGEPFQYLPVNQAIGITQAYVGAFFVGHLLDRTDAFEYLNADSPDPRVTTYHRN